MVECRRGNLFDSGAVAIVNTVNCVGVSGKGVALECKNRYPDNYIAYRDYCSSGLLRPGMLFPFLHKPTMTWILNVATKDHWRNPSKLEWVDLGARLIRAWCLSSWVTTVAIPPMGCGNGGLRWADVCPILYREFSNQLFLTALLFEPSSYSG